MKKRWYNCWLFHSWSNWIMDVRVAEVAALSAVGEPQKRICLICGAPDSKIAKYYR